MAPVVVSNTGTDYTYGSSLNNNAVEMTPFGQCQVSLASRQNMPEDSNDCYTISTAVYKTEVERSTMWVRD
ncbi:NAC domain-containing protein 46 [Clarias magur]|uniref:NAC domain-containing protein 46 n=1 Tax=Clarias magur TaxID=1594786 RepID=A0A8J4X7N3_CLAMG|nr:NAC domain-containing protein 46 [Clarias magur]